MQWECVQYGTKWGLNFLIMNWNIVEMRKKQLVNESDIKAFKKYECICLFFLTENAFSKIKR